jgi:peptidoglycan/xylan/chitin deacetylase (PgdA/CDA1 family)
MHDGGHVRMGVNRDHSVEATGRIIQKYADSGYQFVTIPQMVATSAAS